MLSSIVLSTFALGALASPLTSLQARQLPFGQAIFKCTTPNTVALTFDDGPVALTGALLDQLAEYGFKATFFVNGDNFGLIENQVPLVRRILDEGHHLGSHTWSHKDLGLLDSAGIKQEMNLLEDKLHQLIGKAPTYMRPPFFSYNSNTLATLGELEYHVIHADVDTNDWKFDNTESVAAFSNGIRDGGSIVLMHDVHANTVNTLVPQLLPILRDSGKRGVTLGECLGDPEANWYRTRSTPPASTTTSSTPAPTGGPTVCTKPYVVQTGDFCYKIWTENNLSEAEFRALNPSLNADCLIIIGQELCLASGPAPPASSTTTTTTTPAAPTTTTTTTTPAAPTTTTTTTSAAATTTTTTPAAPTTTSAASTTPSSSTTPPASSTSSFTASTTLATSTSAAGSSTTTHATSTSVYTSTTTHATSTSTGAPTTTPHASSSTSVAPSASVTRRPCGSAKYRRRV